VDRLRRRHRDGITKAASTTLASLVLADFDNAVGSLPQYADTPNAVLGHAPGDLLRHRGEARAGVRRRARLRGPHGQPRAAPAVQGLPGGVRAGHAEHHGGDDRVLPAGRLHAGRAFGDRQQDQIAFSDQASVGGQSVFERNETAVRGIERFDINVHDVGDGTTPGPSSPSPPADPPDVTP
jgi:hypothetical protein